MKASLTRLENFFNDIDADNIDIDEIKVKMHRAEEIAKTLAEILVEISIVDDTLSEVEVDRELGF